jgi:hypothetical protein
VPFDASVELRRHPSTPGATERRIGAQVRRSEPGALDLSFQLEAELRELRIPRPTRPQRADGLWQHTCFEAFIALDGEAGYHELNLAPSGEWALYAFASYRERRPTPSEVPSPSITVRGADDRLELEARISLAGLSPLHSTSPLRIGLCAVIEAADGRLSYWALAHARDQPDFHDARGFTLRLEPPLARC